MPDGEEASHEMSRHRGLVVMEITDQEAKKDLSGMTSDFQTAGENWKIRWTKNYEIHFSKHKIVIIILRSGFDFNLHNM